MKRSSLAIGLCALFAGITAAQETVSITVDANRSCMGWSLQDLATGDRFGSECPGFDQQRQFVRGSCTFSAPAAEPYQFQWGGQFSWPIRITPDGLVEYRAPQDVDGIQPGQNAITFNTSRVALRLRNFPGAFAIESDSVPCEEDPDPVRWARRLFVVNGARFLATGNFRPVGAPEINDGNLFRVGADGELEKVVAPDNSGLAFTQDPFINGRNPNRIIVNRAFWNYDAPESPPTE